MENKYILAYLKQYYQSPKMNRILDYFKVDFDYYLYGYGRQFSPYNDKESKLYCLYEDSCLKRIVYKLSEAYSTTYRSLIVDIKSAVKKVIRKQPVYKATYKKVLFVEPVSDSIKFQFAAKGITIVSLPDYIKRNKTVLVDLIKWYDSLNNLSFVQRLELSRYECLDFYIKTIQKEFSDYEGLFVGNDEYFICKLFIDAFKGINIPTFNWSHGIPCIDEDHERADYHLVWGWGIKKYLIEAGKTEDKIIVSGNINYFDIPEHVSFKNTLDDVLVMTSVTIANIRHTWDYETFDKWDRSLLLTYIYSVEKVLKECGVKKARLRPHPINNILWLEKFIDLDFFIIDKERLDKSLEHSTLVIGPTSSCFVETMRKGVTYLVYEPGDNGRNLNGRKLEPPFDGSDGCMKVATTEDQLKEMITSGYTSNREILEKYMEPFSIDSFLHLIHKKI